MDVLGNFFLPLIPAFSREGRRDKRKFVSLVPSPLAGEGQGEGEEIANGLTRHRNRHAETQCVPVVF